ncbi:MAG: 30S ribosome-binding factor RbfA [Saprospiraceae bacterium]|nr:30S ribosome-binding factor RbfA [Saprospiraceae bacterium]MCB0626868.1 30S ribosome-binding factor RbfA [Saprospiraceae bacterium]MCB0676883.1 30S ribosome-binding factor RbfA [Saprospiraceae bacterium]
METKRQKQIAELIKRNFGLLLQQEGPYIYGSSPLVTVTNVKMSPDLSISKIYLSVYNTDEKQTVILEMEEHLSRLRQSLGNRIKKQVRRIPELQFYLDDTLDEMYRLNDLFDRLEGKEGDAGS